jgi:hypothetical protein
MLSLLYSTSRELSASAETRGSSHLSSEDGPRTTGIRSWIGCIHSLAVVVRIVQDWTSTPCGSCQRSHKPANTNSPHRDDR